MNQKELINSKIISYNDGNAKQVTFIMINIIIHDLKYSTLGFIPNQSEIWVIPKGHPNWNKAPQLEQNYPTLEERTYRLWGWL